MTEIRMDVENDCCWIGNEQNGIQFSKDYFYIWKNGKVVLGMV